LKNLIPYDEFDAVNEDHGTEFTQYKFDIGPQPFGPGYGFAVDPKLSIYSDQDSPYVDQYVRTPWMVKQLKGIVDKVLQTTGNIYAGAKFDKFMEDLDELKNLKILRINRKNNGIDVFVSFEFEEDEFFGVFRNFGKYGQQDFDTELYSDGRFPYITANYRLKLTNFFYKVLCSWFTPKNSRYVAMKDVMARDEYGKELFIKDKTVITVVNSSLSDRIVNIEFGGGNKCFIRNFDYYMFNYWFKEYEDDYRELIK